MSLDRMKKVMETEYNSDARKVKVRATLELIRQGTFMLENEIQDVTDVLTRIVEHINEFPP